MTFRLCGKLFGFEMRKYRPADWLEMQKRADLGNQIPFIPMQPAGSSINASTWAKMNEMK